MNIICGTDFSPSARHAIGLAAEMAAKLGDRLLLVHAIEAEDTAGLGPANVAELEARRADHLRYEAQRFAPAGVLIRETVERGPAEAALANHAARADTRLIVLSSTGEHGGDSVRLGRVSERTAAIASVPVLVVRDPKPLLAWIRGEGILKLFVAFNFTASAEAALAWTKGLPAIGRCALTIGFIGTPPGVQPPGDASEIEAQLRRRVHRIIGPTDAVLALRTEADAVVPALLNLAATAGCDLVVSGTHHRSGWQHLVHGSVSRELLERSRTNVICVPSRQENRTAGVAQAPSRILAATDFSPQGNRAVAHACALAPAGAMVKVVYVAIPGAPEEPGVVRRLHAAIPADAESRGLCIVTDVLTNGDVAEAIRADAERFDADLICVGTKDRSRLSRAAVGSVARTLINHSKRALLVIHPPEP